MFLIIGIWGGERRILRHGSSSSCSPFLGSVFMLVSLVYLYRKAGSLRHSRSSRRGADGAPSSSSCFFGFLAAFAVKVPMWPVPYLAARCARRGADRRFGHTGGHPAEDGRLRHAPVQPAGHA